MSTAPVSLPLQGPLVLVGAGQMGGALLAGLLDGGVPASDVIVQDPAPPPKIAALLAQHGIAAHRALPDLPSKAGVLLLAVKPQVMDETLPPLASHVGPRTLVVSVAAGRTLAGMARHLPAGTAIVRAIPNTPAAVNRGITAAVANAHVGDAQRALADRLLAAVGEVVWVADEALIDVATAVSGSGPAYVFLLAECLAEAGQAAGMPAALARQLADATVAGAGELLRRSGTEPAELRRNVTSPNGTTAAALSVLMAADGLKPLLERAVTAAAQRSRELST